ncbi:hypothetical protein CUJ83_00880 [Methanocella sp. CWC-04]|uniref:Endonuclease/exonuclease/phosphatase domain-containing protein n=2 Tax=Methanooceanicella nereidis TaxID=2052831 RepID=A0AAP2W3V7_9EURY|nr:hypothetical protein [Methanocella sp. CWC-04]
MSGIGDRASSQVEAICGRAPDIIAFQDVTAGSAPKYRAELEHHGYFSIIDSFQFVKYRTRLMSRSIGEILASKWPLISYPEYFDVPWPEKVLSCFFIGPWGDILVHTAHIPPVKNSEWKKYQTLEGIYKGLAAESKYPRILCGDFNTPQEELSDGTIVTWGQKRKRDGEVVLEKYRGQRWDSAERNILEGLAKFDLHDVFRHVNGYDKNDFSFYEKLNGRRIGRRYDHVLASKSLNPLECRYLHDLRKAGLSEHSPIEAVFDPKMSK